MQGTLCVCLLSLVAAVLSGVVSADSNAPSPRRVARGFRMGAADRFSHGFGKRTESTSWENELGSDDFIMTDGDLADLLKTSDRLALLFVQRYVDINGDGMVTKDELFDVARK